MKTTLAIEGIECYSYHGCLDEEAVIGGNYSVDVYVDAALENAVASDNLKDTIDYVMVYDIVRHEMDTRSRLIEHVAGRILKSLMEKVSPLPEVETISVRVTKFNPPVNGQIRTTAIFVSKNRQDV